MSAAAHHMAESQKRAVGQAAAALVQDGMTVGLGSGSTAAFMVQALAARAGRERLGLRCVATSRATATMAGELGLAVVDLDDAGGIDLTLDGADEIGPGLVLIKGAGAALLREKLVWEASRRCVVIADASKRGGPFGRAPLPVEVVAFGHATTARRVTRALERFGLTVEPKLRLQDGAPLATDGGNVLYDLSFRAIGDPAALAATLKAITGVVEHGLFLDLADEALIGTGAGVELMRP